MLCYDRIQTSTQIQQQSYTFLLNTVHKDKIPASGMEFIVNKLLLQVD